MPLALTRYETGKVLSGESTTITRMYDQGQCPHTMGETLILTSEHTGPQSKQLPIARVTITGLERQSLGDRKKNDRLAVLEGHDDALGWYRHFQAMYGGEYSDTTPVHRIKTRIDEMLYKR